jgi:type I restriction enzyme S subunit
MSPEINNSLEIDKSKFKKFRFDQIAFSISERVEPQNTDLEIYYGLEHLDSNSIHLTRNGVPTDVEGTKLRVYPGDIIFGKRRAYQRKAAICKVDAICSAHAMVLRANPKVIHPKLFPFFLHSDLFMNRAIDISVGSLSPTINWGTLREQEFSLPAIDQQEKLAELLWAGDDLIRRQLSLNSIYITSSQSVLNDLINHNIEEGKEYYLGQLGQTFGGLTGKTKLDFGRGKPFITYMNVFKNSKLNIQEVDLCEIGDNENQNKLKFGDIFFTGSSETPEEVGMASVLLDKTDYDVYLNSFCFGFRLNSFDILLPEFARFLFRAKYVRDFMHLHAQGSTRFNLSKTTVKDKLKLYIPSKKRQKEIIEKLEQIVTLEENMKLSRSQTNTIVSEINKMIFNS